MAPWALRISASGLYCAFEATITTSLKFLAAPRISEMPPMSIFSMISASEAPDATVAANGYRSTITRSMAGISYLATSSRSVSLSRRLRMPPKTLGCSVFTRPPSIEG